MFQISSQKKLSCFGCLLAIFQQPSPITEEPLWQTINLNSSLTCPQGFEHILADELKRLRAQSVRPLKGGVAFFGTKVEGYRACLWSRIASRVLRVMGRVEAYSAEALYEGVKALPWATVVGDGATIAVTARGTNDALRNTQFGRAEGEGCRMRPFTRGAR